MPEAGRLARLAMCQPVIGPTVDALVRESAPRLRSTPAFHALVGEWPLEADRNPRDRGALVGRLLTLRQDLDPAPPAPGRRAGSPARALGGLLLGAAAALRIGFIVAGITAAGGLHDAGRRAWATC
jgi:hypothetical protein